VSDFNLTPCNEIFKSIPGHPGYEVSNYGRIRSFWINSGGKWTIMSTPQKYLKIFIRKDGYPQVGLSGGCTFKIHKLILLAFIGPPPPGHEACHKDGIRTRNILSNLYWGTASDNNLDKIKHGKAPICQWKGEKHPEAKITNAQAIEIRNKYASHKYSQRKLAKMFGISQAVISAIILRKNWQHIP